MNLARTSLCTILIALFSLCCTAQVKKGPGKTGAVKKTVVKKTTQPDPDYLGEVGDYLPCVVKFQAGKTIISQQAMNNIGDVAKFLRNHPNVNIVIEGSASVGEKAKELANARAVAVKEALVNRYKISASRLTANGKISYSAGGDFGFVKYFIGTSDAVVFYEKGFITLDEYMRGFQRETDEMLMPLYGAMVGVMLGYSCPVCEGTGWHNGGKCSNCQGNGATEDQKNLAFKDGMQIAKGIAAADRQNVSKVKSTTGTNGWQIKTYENGVYEGHLVNGKRDGWGRMVFKNGECYTGIWKNDKAATRGMIRQRPYKLASNGSDMLCNRHAGEIGADGKLLENRALSRWDGCVYVGNFKNNRFNGYGELLGSRGGIVKANFVDGKPGKGSRTVGAMGTVIANFRGCDTDEEGLPIFNGEGDYQYANGETYHGNIKLNFPSGKGTVTTKDGIKVQGEFGEFGRLSSTKPCIVKYTNGDIFVGRGGTRPDGKGVWYYASTHTYVIGKWKEGLFRDTIESGSYTDGELKAHRGHRRYNNGDEYDGQMDYGVPHGTGVYKYANGDQLSGKFEYGDFGKKGTLTFANGEEYKGSFRNGKMNGKGIYSYPNGDVFIGDFLASERTGIGIMHYNDKNKKYVMGFWKGNDVIVFYEEGKWKIKDGEYVYKVKKKYKAL